MTQANKEYWYRDFTLKGSIYYPDLLEPKPNQAGTLKYGVLFAWDANDPQQAPIVQQIGEFLGKGKQLFAGNIPDEHFKKPIKRWDTYRRQDGKPNADFLNGKYWVNASSGEKFPPRVVNKFKTDILDPAEVYSGRDAVMNFSFYFYSSNGNTGIACNVKAVMLLDQREGDRVGGGTVDVDSAFGSFAADMGAAPAGVDAGMAADAGGQQNVNSFV